MAVTNYFTVDGEIIGESTNGVRLDYLTDALGSVTATVDQTGTVQNTYRYKPYGALLAKTGTAPDPRFLWNGRYGYRTTLCDFSDTYIRARHFGSYCARWTTTDPLVIAVIAKAYIYADSNPIIRIDPSGNLSVVWIETPKATGNCGAAEGTATFKDHKGSGWIVQHIQVQPDVYRCCGMNCSGIPQVPTVNQPLNYYEAWQVISGQLCKGPCATGFPDPTITNPVEPGDYADSYGTSDEKPSCGTIKVIGKVMYIPNIDLQADPNWAVGKVPNAGDLLSSYFPPTKGWDESKTVAHSMTVNFDCCGPGMPEAVSHVP